MTKKINKKTLMIYAFLLVLFTISLAVTNVSYDAEYQMAMAYRMIKGDKLITQMWEPHQTSAFLCAIFMKIYMVVTGTTTGIVLYIQAVGLLIRAAISGLVYRALRKVTDTKPVVLAALLYYIVSPKDLATPEFGNMQLWFATCMLLALLEYFETKKVLFLIGAAVSLCLGVFSYPSFMIAYAAVWIIIWKYSDKKGKDIGVFTAVCAVIGGTFAGYYIWTIGIDTIFHCVSNALALEPSHTVDMFEKMITHLKDIGFVCGLVCVVLAIGAAIEKAWCVVSSKQKNAKVSFSKDRWIIISGFVFQIFFLWNILSVEYRNGFRLILFAIIILGFYKKNMLHDKEKMIYDCALWISIFNLLSTLILSDNAFLPAVPYMLTVICASVMPLYHWYEEIAKESTSLKKMFVYVLHIFLVLVIFRGLFIHIPMYGRGQINSVLSDLALIRSGPAMSIVADEEGAARQRDSMAEWKEYIRAGDTIWLLGEPVDTLGYLYEDVEVGAPTVMSTPTYNEALLDYWEMNPDKYPDVVILASSFGELSWDLARNNWLMKWLEEEYQAETIIDGNYWRYYIRRNETE